MLNKETDPEQGFLVKIIDVLGYDLFWADRPNATYILF